MPELQTIYYVRIPMDGQPDGFVTTIRAITPAVVGEVVRVILSCTDPKITEIRIVVGKELLCKE